MMLSPVRATSAAIAVALVGLCFGSLAAPAGADPLEDARHKRDAAQAEAVGAAQRYTDALSEQAGQESEIARLEAEIPALRARSVELRRQVRERAILLYQQGTAMPLSRMVDAGSVIDATRAIQLTQSAAGHDQDVAAELTQTAAKLERDEAELRTRKAEQDAVVARLADERTLLEAALARSDAALHTIEAVAFAQGSAEGADDVAAGRVKTGATVCPIYGPMAHVNDWGAPRSGGRTHQGNDLFAPYGTADVAVIDGVIRWDFDDLGGQGIWLDGVDGVSYYYAHLSAFEGPPRPVLAGDVIGYVGDTGNAKGGPPHTHFGVKSGGQMVNPYPTIKALCGR
jgi:murein DD-endopeptidase MepM/ murein hydrolase activator NlpD